MKDKLNLDVRMPKHQIGPGEVESPVTESFARYNRRMSAEGARDPFRAMFAERDKIRREVSGICGVGVGAGRL